MISLIIGSWCSMIRSQWLKLFGFLILIFAVESAAQGTSDRISVLTDDHGYFPCSDCHEDQETLHQPRILEEEHAEPLEWEDADGVTHYVSFGEYLPISSLLNFENDIDFEADILGRIGQRIQIETYMAEHGLAPTDSVWTLVHGGGNLWCLDCHNADDRDHLVKLNGELLTFNQSQLLCGECHGPVLRDWRLGIHGKETGYWDLPKDEDSQTVRWLCVECHKPHSPAFPSYQPEAGPVPRIGGPMSTSAKHDSHQETDH